MTQTRLGSFYEACMNIVIGFVINFAANLIILPHVGFDIDVVTNLYIGVLYTAVSLVRQFVIRRWFNAKLHAAAQKLAGE